MRVAEQLLACDGQTSADGGRAVGQGSSYAAISASMLVCIAGELTS